MYLGETDGPNYRFKYFQNVEGVVEMLLDATQNYNQPLDEERLFGWHAALFPIGRSGMHKIDTGCYRNGEM